MNRRKVLLVVVSLLVLAGVILGGIQLVAAMQGGAPDTDNMTKSVARIVFTGAYDGKSYNELEICTGSMVGDGWVLTALHCYFPEDSTESTLLDWKGLQVELWQAGVTNINTPDYISWLSEKPLWMTGGLGGNALNRDVMLLHVAKPMPNWAKTIPTAVEWPLDQTPLTEYGYGDNANFFDGGQPTKYLTKSYQGSIVRAHCPTRDGYVWTSGHICTFVSASLPWQGDSGGPLLWWHNGYWQQVGSFSLFPRGGKHPDPDQNWRSYWSEADGATRAWILSTVGANFAYGTILRDQASGASWLYEADGYRHWIPDGGTYNCLVSNGANVPPGLSLRTIEALPDMVGNHATCVAKAPTVTPPTRTPPTVTPPTVTPPTVAPPTVTPVPSHAVDAYSNYGQSNLWGHSMCRGNPSNPLSMPGGTGTQTFIVPSGVASLSSAKIQIDPAPVTAKLTVAVNGTVEATATATAVGDTYFSFGPVPVRAGDTITLTITFSATAGKIITLYTVGNGTPGGVFTSRNTCPDGASNDTVTNGGLRAVVSGMS